MKRRFARATLALCLLALPAAGRPQAAQKPAAAPAPVKAPAATPVPASQAAVILELFKAMKLQGEVQQMPDAMMNAEISRNPGLAPFRDVMVGWLKKYMTWQAMQPELVKLYAANFTEAELKEMTAFYKTPTGQKALQAMPEVMQRSAMLGAQLAQGHEEELKTAMAARSAQLEKDAEKAKAAGAAGKPPAPAGKPTPAAKKP
jgi:hypothetical protein